MNNVKLELNNKPLIIKTQWLREKELELETNESVMTNAFQEATSNQIEQQENKGSMLKSIDRYIFNSLLLVINRYQKQLIDGFEESNFIIKTTDYLAALKMLSTISLNYNIKTSQNQKITIDFNLFEDEADESDNLS